MSFENIPVELCQHKNWVLWKEEIIDDKRTKVPYQLNGFKASVTNPSHWCDFRSAVLASKNYSGIGLVLFSDFPYSGIDMDNPKGNQEILERQVALHSEFNTYSEISPSGNGLHMWVKGKVPTGVRRNGIEVYSTGRFLTMTGNVYNNVPICDNQALLTQLYNELKGNKNDTSPSKESEPENYTDQQIVDMASKADNKEKFLLLLAGDWKTLGYPSQSEADYAFIDIIAFYTSNKLQISRIFRNSRLGNRPKAKRNDYVNQMIDKSFDRKLPIIDIVGLGTAMPKPINGHPILEPSITFPHGLMGEIAQFIYQASPRPCNEIALAAAIGLMAGICGKAYNYGNSGLNLYVLAVANTGVGKEAGAAGIDILMHEVSKQVLVANEFVGPSEIASGQALSNYLKTNQSFVSILGEFGFRIQALSDPRANNAEKNLLRTMLDLFGKSGTKRRLGANIYADTTRSSASVSAPSMSIYADTTPQTFYDMLDESMIQSGLLPRFLILEYKGKRSYLNYNNNVNPPVELVNKLRTLSVHVKETLTKQQTINVSITEDAFKELDKFDKYSTDVMNENESETIHHLWNRAHLKIQRLAALVAIGINPYYPQIDINCINWASDLVVRDVKLLLSKFETGDVGRTSETKQENEILRTMDEYIMLDWEKIKKYKIGIEKMHKDKVIPYSFINKKLSCMACFKHDKQGPTKAMARALDHMVKTNRIVQIGKEQMQKRYNSTMLAYMIDKR